MGRSLLASSHVSAAPDASIGHLLLQMVVAMVVIVGGIWLFGKLVGRSRAAGRHAGRKAGGFLRQRSHEQGLTVLSRQPLGKGKCLAVVQVGAQQFLVGIADSGLTPLGELRSDVASMPARDVADPSSDRLAAGAFSAADLASVDLGALGARSLQLDTREMAPLGVASLEQGDVASGARSHGSQMQAPPTSRALRSWVEQLREATVRH